MFKCLDKYTTNGHFYFSINSSLRDVCNAPRGYSGIYLIFNEKFKTSNLIYIGISGRAGLNNKIVHRKDGIWGRIVRGKQFGDRRSISWPLKMKEDNISELIIKWWVTFDNNFNDFPRLLERSLLTQYMVKYNRLPIWNKSV